MYRVLTALTNKNCYSRTFSGLFYPFSMIDFNNANMKNSSKLGYRKV